MKYLLFSFFLLCAAGCEILEEDISGKKITIIAPVDKASVAAGSIDFSWMNVPYATTYELIVMSVGGYMVADTVVFADTLGRHTLCRITLAEGEYEWSVTGLNSAYNTRTAVHNLTVLPIEEE